MTDVMTDVFEHFRLIYAARLRREAMGRMEQQIDVYTRGRLATRLDIRTAENRIGSYEESLLSSIDFVSMEIFI